MLKWVGRAARVLVLALATLLCLASSRVLRGGKQRAEVAASSVWNPKKDAELRQPALKIVNYTTELVALALKGRTTRFFIAPPRENFRTLVAAGKYLFVLRRGEKIVRRGKVSFALGHRYRLEVVR